jgi:hypothetical protein
LLWQEFCLSWPEPLALGGTGLLFARLQLFADIAIGSFIPI